MDARKSVRAVFKLNGDEFVTAQPIYGTSARVEASNVSYTKEASEPYHAWKRRSKSAAGGGPIVRHLEAVNEFQGGWSSSMERGFDCELKRAGGRAASPQLAPPGGGTYLRLPTAGLRALEPPLGVLQAVTGAVGFQDVNPVGQAVQQRAR